MQKISDITGLILTGGKSSRFGSNKAFAKWHGVPLIQRILEVMQSVFERCLIVTNHPKDFQNLSVPVVKDVIPHRGPLGGILTGFLYAKNPKIFVTACDTPLLHPEVIQFIVEKGDLADAAIPVNRGIREPLMALYSRNLRPLIMKQLSEERLSMNEFCQKVENRIWVYLEGDYSFNVNTQQDLEILKRNYVESKG